MQNNMSLLKVVYCVFHLCICIYQCKLTFSTMNTVTTWLSDWIRFFISNYSSKYKKKLTGEMQNLVEFTLKIFKKFIMFFLFYTNV